MSGDDHPRGLPVDVPNVEVEQDSGFDIKTDRDGVIREVATDVLVFRIDEEGEAADSACCRVTYRVQDRVATSVSVEREPDGSIRTDDDPELCLWEYIGAVAGANQVVIETGGILEAVIALPEYCTEFYDQSLTPTVPPGFEAAGGDGS
jgi:hypothetical protein